MVILRRTWRSCKAIALCRDPLIRGSPYKSVRLFRSLHGSIASTTREIHHVFLGRDVELFQVGREHIFDPFHECADSARQVAPMRYYEGDVERLVLKIW
jgi:hypothetical protein